jgi:hypothetical protein
MSVKSISSWFLENHNHYQKKRCKMSVENRFVRSICIIGFIVIGMCFTLTGCTSPGAPTVVAQEPSTPTPEVFIPRTAAVPQDPVTPTAEPLPSQIISVDEAWYQYTNYQLGFSFRFPRTALSPYGSCKWTEANGDHSYRPEPLYVPVKVFEDGDTTYIAGEYYHELTGETKETSADGTTRTFFSECRAVTNNLELLRNPSNSYQTSWKIVASAVHSDDELDAFLKSQYGSGCRLGEKMASGQEGVYDVRIQGDGKDLGETQCLLNRVLVVKCYPAGNMVVTWDRGQAPKFVADAAYSTIYDQEMVDSFRFLTEMPIAEGTSATGPGQPVPPVSNELAYTRAEIAEAGLSVDVPAGWLRLEPEWVWTPSADSALRLGVAWADLQPAQEAEAVMLPTSAVVLRSQPFTVDWGNGQLFTVAVYAPASGNGQATLQSVEMHALVVVELNSIRRVYDLYLVAPDEEQAVAQQAMVQWMLDTAMLSTR